MNKMNYLDGEKGKPPLTHNTFGIINNQTL